MAHLKDGHRECVYITCRRSGTIGNQTFRAEVTKASDCLMLTAATFAVHQTRETKVADLDGAAVGYQYVGRLDVAVNNTLVMQIAQSLGDSKHLHSRVQLFALALKFATRHLHSVRIGIG